MDFDKEFQSAPLPADCVPEQVCEACALGAIFHRPTRTTAAYCAHTLTGAVLPLGGTWGTMRGIEAHYFREWLVKMLTQGELLGDVANTIAQGLIEEAKRETKH